MYFIHYFYVSVTDDAPKFPGAESPASSWPCAELSRRRVGGAELSHSDVQAALYQVEMN